MKKRILLSLLCMISLFTYAGDLKFSGDKSVLQDNAMVNIVFDFSNTTWEKDESFKDYCKGDEYEERVNGSKQCFIESFNKTSLGLKVEENASNAKYKMVFRVDDFVQKMSGWGWGRFYIKVYGEIDIQNAATGESVCKIQVKGISANADYVQTDRFKESFAKIAKEINK